MFGCKQPFSAANLCLKGRTFFFFTFVQFGESPTTELWRCTWAYQKWLFTQPTNQTYLGAIGNFINCLRFCTFSCKLNRFISHTVTSTGFIGCQPNYMILLKEQREIAVTRGLVGGNRAKRVHSFFIIDIETYCTMKA